VSVEQTLSSNTEVTKRSAERGEGGKGSVEKTTGGSAEGGEGKG
jgi:hypothetical protein